MPEYTILTFLACLAVVILDLKILSTKLLTQKWYYLFLLLVVILQTIVDNYLNGRWLANTPIVGPYGNQFYSNIVIWHTPLENYFFGLSLVTLNIAVFEYLTSRE